MARLVVVQQRQPGFQSPWVSPHSSLLPSSLSEFNGTGIRFSVEGRRRGWQSKGGLKVSASSAKDILIMGGTRFIGVFLSRLLVREGHQVTLFTREKSPITQQLPGETDEEYAEFSSKILHLKGDRKGFEFVKTSLSAKGFDVVYDINGCEAVEVEPILDALPKLEQYIYCSSAGVYLKSDQLPHFEVDAVDPKSRHKVSRRDAVVLLFSSSIFTQLNSSQEVALAEPLVEFREHIDKFDGYTFLYPKNWIQVRGAGADIFFRDPYVLDENLSVELSSPSSSKYISVEDLGSPQAAAEKVLKQYLTEFMSTRIGVRRESNVLSTSSRVADDGKVYYQVEVNIKSYATSNEMAVMPKDRVLRLEWDRRYLSVLGVENNRLYELRLQTPENVFVEEENDLRRVMQSFRVIKSVA